MILTFFFLLVHLSYKNCLCFVSCIIELAQWVFHTSSTLFFTSVILSVYTHSSPQPSSQPQECLLFLYVFVLLQLARNLAEKKKIFSLTSVSFCLFVCFLPCHTACGILFTQPGIEPGPSAVKAQIPNYWTAREFP